MELWIANTRALGLDCRLEGMLARLPDTEQARALRFLRREDRLRFATGRLMLRGLAAARLGRPDVPLRLSEYGKPRFAWGGAPQFNLSHSGELVVLAVGERCLGVDVEARLSIDWRGLSFTFSQAERAMLEASERPLDCFYRIWTVREALSKERGIGLSMYENDSPDIDYARGTACHRGQALRFRVWEYPDYTLCLCAAELDEVEVRWLTGGDWERIEAAGGDFSQP